jgi:2-keto-4-pentenoate hydratase/2-oxohepta-3-ene-1,7-dioic acid hydratase in catechol pathway
LVQGEWRAPPEWLDGRHDVFREAVGLLYQPLHDAAARRWHRYLQAGDFVECGIEGLGELAQRVVAYRKA